jgi:hypothetical protein
VLNEDANELTRNQLEQFITFNGLKFLNKEQCMSIVPSLYHELEFKGGKGKMAHSVKIHFKIVQNQVTIMKEGTMLNPFNFYSGDDTYLPRFNANWI